MALDGMSSLIRNMIGQENIDQVMIAFEQIRDATVNINAGVNTILQNQKVAEHNAQLRHMQLLELFEVNLAIVAVFKIPILVDCRAAFIDSHPMSRL